MPDWTATADVRCVCGHKGHDHIGMGRCDDASKRCRCDVFHPCDHADTRVLTIHTPGKPDVTMTECRECQEVLE